MRIFLIIFLATLHKILAINATSKINNNSSLKISERIIGGAPVPITDYPYQLSLRLHGNHICGAVLLRHNVALTAAHCVQLPGPYSIKAGSSNLIDGGVAIHINTALVHPNFDRKSVDYDIALLFLARDLQYNRNVRPIKLPDGKEEVKVGMVGKISGWGVVFPSVKALSVQLQAAELPVWSGDECEKRYWNAISERMFCAGYQSGGKDSCQGDSGGPFVIGGVLYGLVSWGVDCAQPGNPGVYTNIPVLRTFINQYGGF